MYGLLDFYRGNCFTANFPTYDLFIFTGEFAGVSVFPRIEAQKAAVRDFAQQPLFHSSSISMIVSSWITVVFACSF